MSDITRNEYWAEINSIASDMASEALSANYGDIDAARDDIWDSRLHETIDGHQWVIYYAYHDDVLRHSDNASYYEDNFGTDDMAATIKERGLDGLKTVMAYFAMYADVGDLIDQALDDAAEELEAA